MFASWLRAGCGASSVALLIFALASLVSLGQAEPVAQFQAARHDLESGTPLSYVSQSRGFGSSPIAINYGHEDNKYGGIQSSARAMSSVSSASALEKPTTQSRAFRSRARSMALKRARKAKAIMMQGRSLRIRRDTDLSPSFEIETNPDYFESMARALDPSADPSASRDSKRGQDSVKQARWRPRAVGQSSDSGEPFSGSVELGGARLDSNEAPQKAVRSDGNTQTLNTASGGTSLGPSPSIGTFTAQTAPNASKRNNNGPLDTAASAGKSASSGGGGGGGGSLGKPAEAAKSALEATPSISAQRQSSGSGGEPKSGPLAGMGLGANSNENDEPKAEGTSGRVTLGSHSVGLSSDDQSPEVAGGRQQQQQQQGSTKPVDTALGLGEIAGDALEDQADSEFDEQAGDFGDSASSASSVGEPAVELSGSSSEPIGGSIGKAGQSADGQRGEPGAAGKAAASGVNEALSSSMALPAGQSLDSNGRNSGPKAAAQTGGDQDDRSKADEKQTRLGLTTVGPVARQPQNSKQQQQQQPIGGALSGAKSGAGEALGRQAETKLEEAAVGEVTGAPSALALPSAKSSSSSADAGKSPHDSAAGQQQQKSAEASEQRAQPNPTKDDEQPASSAESAQEAAESPAGAGRQQTSGESPTVGRSETGSSETPEQPVREEPSAGVSRSEAAPSIIDQSVAESSSEAGKQIAGGPLGGASSMSKGAGDSLERQAETRVKEEPAAGVASTEAKQSIAPSVAKSSEADKQQQQQRVESSSSAPDSPRKSNESPTDEPKLEGRTGGSTDATPALTLPAASSSLAATNSPKSSEPSTTTTASSSVSEKTTTEAPKHEHEHEPEHKSKVADDQHKHKSQVSASSAPPPPYSGGQSSYGSGPSSYGGGQSSYGGGPLASYGGHLASAEHPSAYYGPAAAATATSAKCCAKLAEFSSAASKQVQLVGRVAQSVHYDSRIQPMVRASIASRLYRIRSLLLESRSLADRHQSRPAGKRARAALAELAELGTCSVAGRVKPSLRGQTLKLRRAYANFKRACKGQA